MGWPYHFVDVTEDQKHRRRELLDWYGLVAQSSVLLPLTAALVYQTAIWLSARSQRDPFSQTPSSPQRKRKSRDLGQYVRGAHFRFRRLMWQAADDVNMLGLRLGSVGGIAGMAIWGAWLLLLCFLETGDDYLHLTKRFGIVAASQLPFHYLLSLKSAYSPMQMITRCSHETLNASHQLLGRLITLLLYLHAVLYLIFYVQNGLLIAKLKEAYVLCGVAGVVAFTVIGTTALAPVRRWSYRVFYTVHVVLASALLPILFFHVSHIRIYIYETALVYAVSQGLRQVSTRTRPSRIQLLPGTSLLEIVMSLPDVSTGSSHKPVKRIMQTWQPGQHAYVSMPGHTLLRTFRSNPFTVASLPDHDGQLRFIARVLDGNTVALASSLGMESNADKRDFTIEGPYGVATHADRLLGYDRILFVAGGVGGTFIVPLYRQLLSDLSPGKSYRRQRVSFVWAVRSKAEIQWALPADLAQRDEFNDRLEVYVTKDEVVDSTVGITRQDMATEDAEEGFEMEEQKQLLPSFEDTGDSSNDSMSYTLGRPNTEHIVEQCMKHGGSERVAIVVCGPKTLSRSLRAAIKPWVWRGREVWFWEESFGS